jgi:hypothetical protein
MVYFTDNRCRNAFPPAGSDDAFPKEQPMAKIGDYLNYLVVSQRELRKRQHLIAKSAMAAHGSSDCRFEEVHESSIALIGVMKLRVTPAKGSERFLLSIHCRLPYWGVNASRASIDAYLQWLLYLHEQTDIEDANVACSFSSAPRRVRTSSVNAWSSEGRELWFAIVTNSFLSRFLAVCSRLFTVVTGISMKVAISSCECRDI